MKVAEKLGQFNFQLHKETFHDVDQRNFTDFRSLRSQFLFFSKKRKFHSE